jgi:hypothetical protein
MRFAESTVEHAALSWFQDLGYAGAHAPHLVDSLDANDWLAGSQFTVIEGQSNRRQDQYQHLADEHEHDQDDDDDNNIIINNDNDGGDKGYCRHY